MLTEKVVLDDILKAIEVIRPFVPELVALNPEAGGIASVGLTALYEGAVALRNAEENASPEDIKAALAARLFSVWDEIAKIRFGSAAT